MNRTVHEPVLLEETLALLAPRPGAFAVDATLGGGGHAEAILERSGPDGRLLGLDVDPAALARAGERLARFGARLIAVHASFRALPEVLAERALPPADLLVADLGLSSIQLDDPARGLRFAEETASETPLDMRLDPRLPETAADLLAHASEPELARWFAEYGELRGAHRLARTLVAVRERAPLRMASDLVRVVREARVGGGRRHHPATRVFQALRIAVNDELGALDALLERLPEVLAPGGRAAFIAFHSLEDRRVKRRLREFESPCICPPEVPVCACGRLPQLRRLTRRAVKAGDDEIARNPRARSARLRAAVRLPEAA